MTLKVTDLPSTKMVPPSLSLGQHRSVIFLTTESPFFLLLGRFRLNSPLMAEQENPGSQGLGSEQSNPDLGYRGNQGCCEQQGSLNDWEWRSPGCTGTQITCLVVESTGQGSLRPLMESGVGQARMISDSATELLISAPGFWLWIPSSTALSILRTIESWQKDGWRQGNVFLGKQDSGISVNLPAPSLAIPAAAAALLSNLNSPYEPALARPW